VITGQAFAGAEPVCRSTAVLTAVSVPSEEKRVGDLTAEPSWHVNESDKPNDARPRKGEMLAAEYPIPVHLDDLGLAVDDQPERPPDRNEGQRLERRVKCQATCVQPHMTQIPPRLQNRRAETGS
jgi:hypothetical protein